SAYAGIGFLHGKHRPLQSLLLGAAARGMLAARLVPRAPLVRLDLLAHRLDLAARGRVEAERLDRSACELLDAYLTGFACGLREGGRPFELRALAARLPDLDRASIMSAVIFSAYAGASQGQERMERALVDALAAGADPELLAAMFHPHLDGWDPARLAALPRIPGPGMVAHGLVGMGGSNAWAVDGSRSASGKPILCGDPHLQVNQMPGLFFEFRARVGDDFWLGVTIPGLPGVVVGRTRRLAWSSTFSVADNVDFTIERLEGGRVMRPGGPRPLVSRQVEVRRRFRSPLRVSFHATEHGVLERSEPDGETLAVQWCGAERASDMLSAFLELPTAPDAAHAETILDRAHTFSLHWVLADAGGDVRTRTTGRIPKRSAEWSGLYPVAAGGDAHWVGFYEGAGLPRALAADGLVASANEARDAPDGAPLSTMAQPRYRVDRIVGLLRARSDHDRVSMQRMQLDLHSGQAAKLLPSLVAPLPAGELRSVLGGWDLCYDADSRGAHAFELARDAAIAALAPELGDDWLTGMLATSELPVWWCAAFDRVLADEMSWHGERGERLRAALAAKAFTSPSPWGSVQCFSMTHMIFGGLPGLFGFDRGPYPLPGCPATIRQGYVVQIDGAPLAIAPAFRMVCDLADDAAWTCVAGGIDGSRYSDSYDRWVDDWRAGTYHRLAPPDASEG
ncbi:MAG: penicillin acylase family protein, partial [Myxococcota bacterium]